MNSTTDAAAQRCGGNGGIDVVVTKTDFDHLARPQAQGNLPVRSAAFKLDGTPLAQ